MPEASWTSSTRNPETVNPASIPQSSNQMLALRQSVTLDCAQSAPDPQIARSPAPAIDREIAELPAQPRGGTTAKIIEFPRSACAPPARLNELADPVMDRPRILEAPEVVPPPPAMGGITIDEASRVAPERRPGIDMPLQPAALEHHLLAVAIDAAIVLLAAAAFSTIFYQLTHIRPPLSQLTGLGAGLLGTFWAAYQYLLIVYSGTTPGLRAMRLQLQRFDGTLTSRRVRRWRVLGSMLSGISLGMGYAWQFLDEDGLCWHERVTKTYLAPRPGAESC
jgi:hypothetical protein